MSEAEAATSSSDSTTETPNEIIAENMTDFAEPESKRRKISQKSDEKKRKLEERLGGILCCVVCLDLPNAAVYQQGCSTSLSY